jgi:hypothetical protein
MGLRTNALRSARPSRRSLAAAIGASLALAIGLVGASPDQARAATIRTIHAGDNVLTAFQGLRAGDTLLLAAGTYNTGYLRVIPMAAGTAAAPITIRALDPSHPPLLVGGLRFYSPMYLVLKSLRVQATSPGLSALVMDGGIGWTVDSSEFWGARQTKAYANVTISGTGGYPRAWAFTQNCVHDAAMNTGPGATDHNVYVTYQGAIPTTGLLIRNLIYGAPHGENIKLGNGGLYGTLGPWGVRVANNTLASGGRQILLHGNVGNNVIVGNLFYNATQGFVANPETTQVYVHDVTGSGNYMSHSYSAVSSMLMYDPTLRVFLGPGNVTGANPGFDAVGVCTGYHPSLAAAVPYGRWGTGSWSR